MLFDSVLFAKWAELGSTLQGQLGAPMADAKSVFFGRGGSVRIAMFQRGAIAARGNGRVRGARPDLRALARA